MRGDLILRGEFYPLIFSRIYLRMVANDINRGFQPIGSYHRQLSNAARASAATS